MESSDEELSATPPELIEAARNVELNLLPSKSRKVYNDTYNRFMDYCKDKGVSSFSESVLLSYFAQLSERLKCSTLWSTFSMLKATLTIHHNVDIGKYLKLRAFLKRKSECYRPKKSRVLEREQITKFLLEAPDDIYLATKVRL